MTASSNASRRIAAGMLALSLVLYPLSACGKKAPEGPAAVTEAEGPTEGEAEIDEEATSPDAEAPSYQARTLEDAAWVLTKSTYREESDGNSLEEVVSYTLDEHGNVTEQVGKSVDGTGNESTWTYTYQFNEQGNPSQLTSVANGEEQGTASYTYELDDEGRVITRIEGDSGYEQFVYGEDGNIVERTYIMSYDGSPDSYDIKMVSTYDKQGFVTSFEVDDNVEPYTNEYVYDYGPNGLPISCGILRDGEPSGTINFEYDENGNITHTTSTTSQGTTTCDYEWTKVEEPTLMVKAENALRIIQ